MLLANNAISHRETLKAMSNKALMDEPIDAVIMLIGRGNCFVVISKSIAGKKRTYPEHPIDPSHLSI